MLSFLEIMHYFPLSSSCWIWFNNSPEFCSPFAPRCPETLVISRVIGGLDDNQFGQGFCKLLLTILFMGETLFLPLLVTAVSYSWTSGIAPIFLRAHKPHNHIEVGPYWGIIVIVVSCCIQMFGLGLEFLHTEQCEVTAASSSVGLHTYSVLLKNLEDHINIVSVWIQAVWSSVIASWKI